MTICRTSKCPAAVWRSPRSRVRRPPSPPAPASSARYSPPSAPTPRPRSGASLGTRRFSGPYLRDALLDIGVGCETLETVTSWANLDALKTAVTAALSEALPEPTVVMCHISHTYATGASLYFTVVYRQDGEPSNSGWPPNAR